MPAAWRATHLPENSVTQRWDRGVACRACMLMAYRGDCCLITFGMPDCAGRGLPGRAGYFAASFPQAFGARSTGRCLSAGPGHLRPAAATCQWQAAARRCFVGLDNCLHTNHHRAECCRMSCATTTRRCGPAWQGCWHCTVRFSGAGVPAKRRQAEEAAVAPRLPEPDPRQESFDFLTQSPDDIVMAARQQPSGLPQAARSQTAAPASQQAHGAPTSSAQARPPTKAKVSHSGKTAPHRAVAPGTQLEPAAGTADAAGAEGSGFRPRNRTW